MIDDENEEVSQKLSEDENVKSPPPTEFVLSVVNDGKEFREKFTNPSDKDEDDGVKYHQI